MEGLLKYYIDSGLRPFQRNPRSQSPHHLQPKRVAWLQVTPAGKHLLLHCDRKPEIGVGSNQDSPKSRRSDTQNLKDRLSRAHSPSHDVRLAGELPLPEPI